MRPGPNRAATNAILGKWAKHLPGRVLSVGSGRDADGAGGRYRDYFRDAASYTTSDVVATPLCDLQLDARAMTSVPDASYEAVLCSFVLEHVDDCHAAVAECRRVLAPGGVLLVGLPFQQPLHRVPGDYWRFTEFGVRYLLRGFDVRKVVPIGPAAFPYSYWAWAVKPC